MTSALYSTDTAARIAAQESLRRVQESIARQRLARPLTLVESFERVAAVLDRAAIQTLVRRMAAETPAKNGAEGAVVCDMPDAFLYQRDSSAASPAATAACSPAPATSALPSSVASAAMAVHHFLPASLRFPVICKSVAACGSAASHRMYVLQRPADFDLMHAHESVHAAVPPVPSGAHTDAAPAPAPAPAPSAAPAPVWLVQQYVNHAGVLYKVYVLDQELHVVAKVSGLTGCAALRFCFFLLLFFLQSRAYLMQSPAVTRVTCRLIRLSIVLVASLCCCCFCVCSCFCSPPCPTCTRTRRLATSTARTWRCTRWGRHRTQRGRHMPPLRPCRCLCRLM